MFGNAKGRGIEKRYHEKGVVVQTDVLYNVADSAKSIITSIAANSSDDSFDGSGYHAV